MVIKSLSPNIALILSFLCVVKKTKNKPELFNARVIMRKKKELRKIKWAGINLDETIKILDCDCLDINITARYDSSIQYDSS